MAVISIIVTVEEQAVGHTQEICANLSRCGLTVENEMPELGLIFGRCEAARLPDLARVEGVAEARAEERVNLPPLRGDTPQ